MREKNLLNTESLNVVLFSLLSIILGMQVLIWAGFVFSFIPIKPTIQFVVYKVLVHPEREIFLYRIFVIFVLLFNVFFVFLFRGQLCKKTLTKKLTHFLIADSIVLFLTFLILFKMVIFDLPQWTKFALCILLGVGIGVKIFYRFLGQIIDNTIYLAKKFSWGADLCVVVFLAVLFYMPDLTGTVAELFHIDKFFHWQAFILSSGVAAYKGCILHVDNFSIYGVGMPIAVSQIARWLGGFRYENILFVFTATFFIYFVCVYVFLRMWLKSVGVAVFGVILAVKFQMFSYAAGGHVWCTPGSSVVRWFFDIFVFFFLGLHLKNFLWRYVLASALCVGLGLFYILDSGVYLMVSFWAYLGMLLLLKDFRHKKISTLKARVGYGGLFALPATFALMLFWLSAGSALWTKEYWLSLTETIHFFLSGFGALPIYDGLQKKEFAFFFIGCLFPIFYLFHIGTTSALIFLKKIHYRNIFVIVLGIYGLCAYHYFVGRSGSSSYFSVSVPLALILCFWIDKAVGFLSTKNRARALFLGILILLAILLTSPIYLSYPNIFNVDKEKMNSYKREMTEIHEQVIDKDVALIQRLVPEDKEAFVFSSLAPQLIILADRKPGLYFVDIAMSYSFLDEKLFNPLFLFTQKRTEVLLRKMREKNPEYIFIEKPFIEGDTASFAYNHHPDFYVLMKEISEKYVIFDRGEQLVVLKRRL
ncbi:MAG: hypothetical protein P9M07_06300 [Candidatus Aceula meridiana]|nr:hypothetical protein [Candidatus Aceula meridiana]